MGKKKGAPVAADATVTLAVEPQSPTKGGGKPLSKSAGNNVGFREEASSEATLAPEFRDIELKAPVVELSLSQRLARRWKNTIELITWANFELLMEINADPVKEAVKRGVVVDASRIEVLAEFLLYFVFLGVFLTSIFVRGDLEQPYRAQFALRNYLSNTELTPSSKTVFSDISSVPEIFDFAKNLLLPSLFSQSYVYNSVPLPPSDSGQSPYFFAASQLSLGTVRVRQLRVKPTKCYNSTATASDSLCYPSYLLGVTDDRADYMPTGEGARLFGYDNSSRIDKLPWQSPITFITYAPGGYILDLPVGASASTAALADLYASRFVDVATAALFFDYSTYVPSTDVLTTVRLSFEHLPSGVWVPFMEIVPTGMMGVIRVAEDDEALPQSLIAMNCEIVVYLSVIVGFAFRALAHYRNSASFVSYIREPWNTVDGLSVVCFVVVVVLRVDWMTQGKRLKYDVDPTIPHSENDGLNYFHTARAATESYTFGRMFLAFGTLLSFLKMTRYCSISRNLDVLMMSVERASTAMLGMALLFGIVMSSFAVSFYMAFQSNAAYRDYPSSIMSLLLLALGDFDAQGIRASNPELAYSLFFFYAFVIIFIVMTMMLKVVDQVYEEIATEREFENHTLLQLANEGVQKKQVEVGVQVKIALKKILFDVYWAAKGKRVLDEKELKKQKEEEAIKAKEAERKRKLAAAFAAKREVDKSKAAAELAKKNLSTGGRKKGNKKVWAPGAEKVDDSTLPENVAIVRQAIRDGCMDAIDEEIIDPSEIQYRLDLMAHRTEVTKKSVNRLMDSVFTFVEEQRRFMYSQTKGGEEKDDDLGAILRAPPYGKTGELFGLGGVAKVTDQIKITDWDHEENKTSQLVLERPTLSKELMEMADTKAEVGADDVAKLYKVIGKYDKK